MVRTYPSLVPVICVIKKHPFGDSHAPGVGHESPSQFHPGSAFGWVLHPDTEFAQSLERVGRELLFLLESWR